MAKVKGFDEDTEYDTETCKYCKGDSSARKADGTRMSSKEWCEEMKTCAATIDWDEVYNK